MKGFYDQIARIVNKKLMQVFSFFLENKFMYIQMGENMAYSDNTCPHCGTTMDRD